MNKLAMINRSLAANPYAMLIGVHDREHYRDGRFPFYNARSIGQEIDFIVAPGEPILLETDIPDFLNRLHGFMNRLVPELPRAAEDFYEKAAVKPFDITKNVYGDGLVFGTTEFYEKGIGTFEEVTTVKLKDLPKPATKLPSPPREFDRRAIIRVYPNEKSARHVEDNWPACNMCNQDMCECDELMSAPLTVFQRTQEIA